MSAFAFLTLEDRADFVIDDALAIAELQRRGHTVDEVPWRRELDWSRYARVVVRSTWDYQRDPDAFLAALARIARITSLSNPLEVIRWNLRKTYLAELARSVPIVPTEFGVPPVDVTHLEALAERGPSVLKPVISANADHTYVLDAQTPRARWDEIARVYQGRAWMLQPFVRSVVAVGEYSLFWFGGRYSHAILKTPRAGDFRVQEEHGGEIVAIQPPPDVHAAAARVIAAVDTPLLQARVDLVRLDDGTPALMELELIEPSLYFRLDAGAPARFADALEAITPPR